MTTIEVIVSVLARHPQIKLAILFGSLAAGPARTDSDLELAVAADEPLTADTKLALISDLAEHIGRPVDLIDLTRAGEPLLGQILTHGRRVLGSDERYAQLLRRHLIATAYWPSGGVRGSRGDRAETRIVAPLPGPGDRKVPS